MRAATSELLPSFVQMDWLGRVLNTSCCARRALCVACWNWLGTLNQLASLLLASARNRSSLPRARSGAPLYWKSSRIILIRLMCERCIFETTSSMVSAVSCQRKSRDQRKSRHGQSRM